MAEPLTPGEALQILLPVRDALRRLDADRAAAPGLDVERLREVYHDRYNHESDMGCRHINQHHKTWDCAQTANEISAYYDAARAAAPSVEPYTDDASPEPTPGLREATPERFQCGNCGDWLELQWIVGHLLSEGRDPAALAASPAPEPRRCEHGAIREPCIPCSEAAPEPTGLDAAEIETMANDLDYISRTLDRASKGQMGHVRVWAQADLPNLRRIINRLRAARLREQPDEGVGT